MQVCTRPHCSIRNHHHDFTFADFLQLNDHYRKIARSLKDVDNTSAKNIRNYLNLSNSLLLHNKRVCYDILVEMLKFQETATNLDLRKLAALYVFSMCKTRHIINFIESEKPLLKNVMCDAYNRVLKEAESIGDKLFVSEMKKLVPIFN